MKAIFWDFDATLGYNDGKWTGTASRLANAKYPELNILRDDIHPHMGGGRFPWDHSTTAHPGQTADEWWGALKPMLADVYQKAGVDKEKATELAGMMRSAYLDISQWHTFDDTAPCLSELKEMGWKHYILSNHVPELPELVDQLGISELFEEVSTSAITGYEKPNPDAYLALRRKLPEDATVWMIGDNIKADVLGAEKAGLPAILVRGTDERATHSFETLYEVVEFLKEEI